MATLYGAGEITEVEEGLDSKSNLGKHVKSFCTEDDINQLFESIRISARNLGSSQVRRDNIGKKSMKRPMRVGSSAIGISEPISLKQALRGLSISQASEMAALKRLSKTTGAAGVLEAGTLKKSRRAAVLDSNENKSHVNLVELSVVPQRTIPNFYEKRKNQIADSSTASDDGVRPTATVLAQSRNLKLKMSSLSTRCKKKLPVVDEISPASGEEFKELVFQDKKPKVDLDSASSPSCSSSGRKLIKPLFRNKNLVKLKNKLDSTPVTGSPRAFSKENVDDLGSTTGIANSQNASPSSSSAKVGFGEGLSSMDSSASKPVLITDCEKIPQEVVEKAEGKSRSREKGDFSQSSKSSVGEYSSSTSSDESNLSGSSHSGFRPHMSKDLRWEAVSCIQKQHGNIGLRHFKLIKKLGGGDVGTVYLAELMGSNFLFALKVMDNELLSLKKKVARAETEKEILQLLDHPFLPTLYAQFTTDKYSCLVIEYCPGGDLHVLRQKQPNKYFSEQATRFYVAEILLALEYLHMLGVVYRDLKPENILVREDGHIMLTDFDLCLRCVPNPTLLKPTLPDLEPPKNIESSCADPFCLQQSWQVPCFTPRLQSAESKSRNLKSDLVVQVSPLPQLVVEPVSARSNSFVGTHEYLAPEIIKGEGHGSPVDWWTFGILLYELLYGRTPFKGTGNEDTLANVVSQDLKFPDSPIGSLHARDLIRRLLRKQPENRLGSLKGAAEIKQHPFFEGLNWALVRCATPPEMPKTCDFRTVSEAVCSKNIENEKFEKELKDKGYDTIQSKGSWAPMCCNYKVGNMVGLLLIW